MLDLQVYGVILIVVLFSLGSILLISKLPRGKTFDEMLEEQRQFKAQLLAASTQNEKVSGGNKKDNNKNKKGKNQPKKGNKKSPALVTKPKQETEESNGDVESDTASDRSGPETSPVHTNKKSKDVNMDFIETEAFPIADHIPTKNAHKSKKNKKGGILVNKSEHPLVSSETIVEEINHFAEIHPHDAIEIHRMHSVEESTDATLHKNIKAVKEKKGRKYTPPISPVNQIKDNKLAEEAEIVVEQHVPVKEKPAKKKKSDPVTSAVVPKETPNVHQYDEDTVRAMLRTLGTAELTRNEIQILIDFLLNKQHDTTAKDPTEWSEGKSDVLQKLKKQLQEKEKQLMDEQEASNAFQSKLRELRTEINAEKSHFNASIKHHIEELNNKKKELQNMSTELHYSNEKHNAEKTALSQQLQQLQAKFMQIKNETGASQEAIQKYQQLTVQHEQLKQELLERNSVLGELQRRENEVERLCHQKDEQLKFLDNKARQDQQVLRTELEKLHQSYEQVKHQLAEVQTKTANQNHVDDANKVEIKNLQNALDSSRKELNSYKTQFEETSLELNDLKQKSDKTSSETVVQITEMKSLIGNLKTNLIEKEGKLDEYETLIKRLRLEQDELRSEMDQQKTKNNDLRTKNWKLIEALQAAQNSNKSSSRNNQVDSAPAVEVNIDQIIADEQNRTKEMLLNLLPELPSNGPSEFNKWLEFTSSFINKQLTTTAAAAQNSSNINSKIHNMNGNESISSSTSSSDANNSSEALLLQNAQLQKSLDEYKNIVADTEKVLRNLEAKVSERDSYWQTVVQSKEDEILILKNSAQS